MESPLPLTDYRDSPESPPPEVAPLEPFIPDYRCPRLHPSPIRRRIQRWWHRPSTHISQLCQDELEMVFRHLPATVDKGRAAQVCSAWRVAADSASVWQGVEARLQLRVDSQTDEVTWDSLRRRRIRDVRLESSSWKGLHDLLRKMPLTTAVAFHCRDIGMMEVEGIAEVATKSRNLQSLDLTGCPVTDASLRWIAICFRQLKRLDLTRCEHVTDQGIKYLAIGLRDLEVLVLASGGVGITDQCLYNVYKGMRKLHSLDISGCHKITDNGLRYVGSMPSLLTLNLSFRRDISSHTLLHLVAGSSHLRHLRLESCVNIKNTVLYCMGKLTTLRELSLAHCRICDVGLAYLARVECRVEVLDLSSCEEVTDIGLSYLSALTSLRRLNLSGCRRVSIGGLGCLRKTRLESLTLTDCSIVGRGALAKMAVTLFGLRRLRLDQGHVNDVGLVMAACNLVGLETLMVGGLERMADIKKIRASPSIIRLVTTLPIWTTRHSHPHPDPDPIDTPLPPLPPCVLALIFRNLDVPDKAHAAQVCTAWRDACYTPYVWRGMEVRLRLLSQSRLPQAQNVPWSSLAARGVRRVRVYSRKLWGLRHLVNGLPNLRSLSIPVHLHQASLLTRFFTMDLPRLTDLRLEYCDTIQDECVQLIAGHMVNLTCLEMPGATLITDAALLAILELTKLRRLLVTQCRFVTDAGVAHLGTRPGNAPLTGLVIRYANHLTDQSLIHINTHLSSLEFLDLSGCLKLTMFTTPAPMVVAATARRDRKLPKPVKPESVVRVAVTGCLTRLTKLRYLRLSGCIGIGDSGLAQLADSKVIALDLEACVGITDLGLNHLARMTMLRHLDLSFNDQISEAGLLALATGKGGSSRLDSLNVRRCDGLTVGAMLVIARWFPRLRSLTLDQRHVCERGLHLAGAVLGEQLHTLRVSGVNRINEIRSVRLRGMINAIGVAR